MTLTERDNQVIWHPYTQMLNPIAIGSHPIGIVKGEGAYLFDENGKKFIDAISSWWVNLHGHAHPYIAEKISEQLKKLEHVIFAGFTHEPAVELAERLLKILPSNQSRIFYSDNGSTAVEVGLKMALQYWHNKGLKKTKVIAFEHCYHGDTFGAMSVSARSAFTKSFESLLFEVIHIPLPLKGQEKKSLGTLTSVLDEHKNEIAAFIFEPLVLGAGGMLMYEADALDQLLKLCEEHKVITIADEVMTGFGRTGKLFACHYLQHHPDILCLSKGITGGTMPFGVTSCSQTIFDAFLSEEATATLFHGHSYTANPIACTAALASLDLLLDTSCQESMTYISKQHSEFVKKLHEMGITSARSTGTILALEFKTEESTSYFHSQRNELYNFFLENGIILRPLGNTIYVIPPYCISKEDLNYIYETILKKMS
jgi:adenosylmethionine---8-amino-7-oxononanoate aminotransferase